MEEVLSNVHNTGRCCISFHPSSEYLCIGGFDGFIKQYSYGLSSNKLSLSNAMDSSSQYHDDPINEIRYSQSGDYFALCCDDGEVALFRHPDCGTNSLLCKYDCPVSSISFLYEPHSFIFAMSTDNGKIKIVNALDCNTKYFEFPSTHINNDGIRFIKFIPYKPDPKRMSRDKYLAVAECNGNFKIWKILKSNIFDQNIKQIDEKILQIQQFKNVFPKIKGGDVNQRLEFDCSKNGELIAIPGNKSIKLLATKSMTFISEDVNNMNHTSNINCCAFNHFLAEESVDNNNYILASSDIDGTVFIWNIQYGEDTFKSSIIEQILGNVAICNLVWKNENELFVSKSNANIYKYCLKNELEKNENANSNKNSNEIKEEEKTMDGDSDEDFDIDMDDNGSGAPSPTKKILRKRTFDESDSDKSPSPSPTTQLHTNTINTMNKMNAEKSPIADTLQAELAAAAEMFGDDDDGDSVKETTKMNVKSFYAEEAVDKNMDKAKEKEEEDILMEDNGEDLNDFIVDDNGNEKKEEIGKEIIDDDMMDVRDDRDDIDDIDDRGDRDNDIMYYKENNHETFMNGATTYDEDGQRYLLMNNIGAVIIRKQNFSTNQMEMNIMNALNNGKYCLEIDFFDKSRYQRAVTMKTDHHFVCGDMNCYGLLVGSLPNNDDICESIIRYKPISRNNKYRSFSSEKDCEWNHVLPPGEICVCVGLTSKYALIATNKRYLRILSIGGLQVNDIISLPKNVINIAGNTSLNNNNNNNVTITFDDYSLWILDLDLNKKIYDGYCAVTNNESIITRVFMIKNKVITIDSHNCVRLLCDNRFGYNWIVILDINNYLTKHYPMTLNNNNNNNNNKMKTINSMRPKGVWPVYFDYDEQSLMVIELQFQDYPIPSQTNGSYILSDYKLSLPLLNMEQYSMDDNENDNVQVVMFGDHEEKIMRQRMLREFNEKNDKQHKKKLLKEYITLFNHACKSNKQVLAYDIALHFLQSEKALSNAIKIAMHNKLPLLAEQLSNLAKQKININTNKNNYNDNNNDHSVLKKPIRSLGKLKRPTAKLGGNNRKTLENNNNIINNVTSSMQRTQLIGKKRPNNPCQNSQSAQPPPKKRNPFSCNNNKRSSNNYNDKQHNNSIFTV